MIKDQPKGKHRQHKIEKVVDNLAQIKKNACKTIQNDLGGFLNIVRLHKKPSMTRNSMRERCRHKSKKEHSGRIDGSSPNLFWRTLQLAFSTNSAHQYFKSSFEDTSESYAGLPVWVHEEMSKSQQEDFDTSEITPDQIRITLKSCDKSSSPGDNSISYYHLWHLPACHPFLAALFTLILADSHKCPGIRTQG